MTQIRTGQAPPSLTRAQFQERFQVRFHDPAFAVEREAIARLEAIAWGALQEGRKAPITRPAGRGFADPTCELSVQWLDTRKRLKAAQKRWSDSAAPSRVLLVCGSARNDGTCPGEVSKTWRLTQLARRVIARAGVQADDWMAEIHERWVAAHAVIVLAPTHWYQSPSPLKLMIDRLVSADGGNPDPTTTHGKHVAEAKRIEQQGWHYPKHLAGRAYGVVVHGDVAGVEAHRRNLTDWLDWMGLIDAGTAARLDRYIGYYAPYYNSHDALDQDKAVKALRDGQLSPPDQRLKAPRTK
jgi:multimeric flavodoxin WrbA